MLQGLTVYDIHAVYTVYIWLFSRFSPLIQFVHTEMEHQMGQLGKGPGDEELRRAPKTRASWHNDTVTDFIFIVLQLV